MLNILTLFVFNIVIYSIPILYGTCGEIMIEKSGSLNLGVEGTMAVGAIFGYLAGTAADSLLVGILVSFITAGAIGALFSYLTVTLQANQNVTGLTITTFGIALYFFIGIGLGTKWPALRDSARLQASIENIELPFLSKIPFFGKALFSHNILVYAGFVMAILMWVYFEKTKYGLKLRAIGENPAAADSVGVNVTLYKYIHTIIGSGIMGIGGLYMGLNMGGTFEGSNCWINGYGWISIALVIFANWNPLIALIGTFVFGLFNTLRIYNTPLAEAFPHTLGWLNYVPAQFLSALPFIITLVVLIIHSMRQDKKSSGPAAIGLNYYREDR